MQIRGSGWNHNVHYGRRLLDLVPIGALDALDVGCGDGWLVRELHTRIEHVVGIDPDGGCIATALATDHTDGMQYINAHFLTHPFEPGSFDVVTAVASLHHLDEQAALIRMAELLRPGGRLGIVGLARSSSPRDFAFDVAGVFATRAHRLTKGYQETSTPKIWPPPHTYGELRTLSARVLPGRRFRRMAMWRYILTWTRM